MAVVTNHRRSLVPAISESSLEYAIAALLFFFRTVDLVFVNIC